MGLSGRKGITLPLNWVVLKRNFKSLIGKYTHPLNMRFSMKYPQLPDRFKGTFVEKWVDYWKNLSRDYGEVLRDTGTSIKTNPARTGVLLTLFGAGIYCVKNNPDESNYRDAIINASLQMIFVGQMIRNPKCVSYLKDIENSFNEGTLHRMSFGLFSIIWKDDYNECLGIYKSQCKYLGVPFYRVYERIIDVGFMNKWFILDKNMVDYDVNPEEWEKAKDI